MTTTTVSELAFTSAAEEATYKRRWIALLLLSLSLTLIIVDSTIVNIAFPTIRATFGASFADAEWVNSIYSLVFAAGLITWGKLGDQYGRRNIFVAGAAVFALASFGTGLSPSIAVMIAFRSLQGMGAAMMSPSTLSIISATFKGKERGMAFGIWGATAGVAAALGPIMGGWLIEYGTSIMAESWRLAFLINLPISAIAMAGAFWAIRESKDNRTTHTIDGMGILLASISLTAIVFATIEGQNYGWLEARRVFMLGPIQYPVLAAGASVTPGTPSFIPFLYVFGALTFLLFFLFERRKERRGGEPLVEFGLLRYRSFRFGMVTVLIVALGEFGIVLALSIYFQLAKGLGAFETGVQFLPFALVVMVAAPTAGMLSSRFGAKWVVTTGMALEGLSLFWLSQTLAVDTPSLALPLMVYGAGVGLAIAQLANIVLSDIPADKIGLASGANNTVRQLGAAFGIAVIGAVLFGNFARLSTPLIQQTTVFEELSSKINADTQISKEARIIGGQLGSFAPQIKAAIVTGLDNNEGYDSHQNPLDSFLAQIPPVGKAALLLQGVNLNDQAVVARIKSDLAPYLKQMSDTLQNLLGTGFSAAARDSALLASAFVLCGAISSLMLPNNRRREGEQVVLAAH